MEHNKLIAEFMGFKVIQMSGNNNPIYNIPTTEGIGYVPKFMKYHKSWDWLMPVVEKIESLKIKDYNTNVYITSGKVYISVTHFGTGGIWSVLLSNYNELYVNKTKIEKVYIAVVEFIKWYNKNK